MYCVGGGVIVSLYMLRNCVYGCGVFMCRSSGLANFVIFSSSLMSSLYWLLL